MKFGLRTLFFGAMLVLAARTAGAAPVVDRLYVLALNWQPAFCESNARKPECRTQHERRFDAGNFSLHGLWPQPSRYQYCNVTDALRAASENGRWRDIPAPALSASTAAELDMAMPGRQSFLDRHQWVKHGTCYAVARPEIYFRDSLRLLRAVNASPLRDLMNSRIGQWLGASEIRAQFDDAFGVGAGERVRVSCREDGGRRLINEITFGLRGDISGGEALPDLLRAAPRVRGGCQGGFVDGVGLQ